MSVPTPHPDGKLYDEKRLAEFFGVTVYALQSWRVKGGGPVFVRIGRCIRYRHADVMTWLDARTCANTSQEIR